MRAGLGEIAVERSQNVVHRVSDQAQWMLCRHPLLEVHIGEQIPRPCIRTSPLCLGFGETLVPFRQGGGKPECERSAQNRTRRDKNAIARSFISVMISSDNFGGPDIRQLRRPRNVAFIQGNIVIDTVFNPHISSTVDMAGRPHVTFKSSDGRTQ
jgi:hypothetical protein